MQEMYKTWVQSLSQEDPLEDEMATQYSWLDPMDRGAWRAMVHGVAKSWTRLKQLRMQACLHLLE